MELKKHDNRLCLFYKKEDVIMCIPERREFSYGSKDVAFTAFNKGLLEPHKQIFLSITSHISVVYEPENNCVCSYQMRENWNGYHYSFVYSLPDWNIAGEIIYPIGGTYLDVWNNRIADSPPYETLKPSVLFPYTQADLMEIVRGDFLGARGNVVGQYDSTRIAFFVLESPNDLPHCTMLSVPKGNLKLVEKERGT